ncbi:hypothetical protein CEXT_204081 [Caerostris extrusa]|uniref:Uncharacterized protein n=1 Tax=Caerostris extrusa TaxID=172846 RepID=A0AAV4W722_CAEEX|nr:hypothetical protein CEXT_204081 [Caerostris extrusa]
MLWNKNNGQSRDRRSEAIGNSCVPGDQDSGSPFRSEMVPPGKLEIEDSVNVTKSPKASRAEQSIRQRSITCGLKGLTNRERGEEESIVHHPSPEEFLFSSLTMEVTQALGLHRIALRNRNTRSGVCCSRLYICVCTSTGCFQLFGR